MSKGGQGARDLSADKARALALFPVSRETQDRLDQFVETLLRWQDRLNLIANSTIGEIWTRHIADSLQLLPLAPQARTWVDLGSGGGFPGMVVACALAEEAGTRVHLVESNGKKAAFLREAVRATGTPVVVHAIRAEKFGESCAEPVDAVTARALAPLKTLCDQAFPFISRGAIGLFPKGQDVDAELTEAAKYWRLEAFKSAQQDQSRRFDRPDSRSRGSIERQIRLGADSGGLRGHRSTNGKLPMTESATSNQPADTPVVAFDKPAVKPGSARPRVLGIANQKGGVGKTTTAINLGTALAAIGEHVLIVDLDPQGNASTGLGIERKSRRTSTYDVLTGAAPMRDAVLQTAVPQLYIAPSTLDLSGLELEIGQQRDRAFRLRNALRQLNTGVRPYDFTYVLVDCPPSLNLLTVNAMAAADSILVPLQCEFFALEGLSQLLKTVEQVKTTLNPTLSIHGIVLTMYDSRNNLSNQVVADVRQFMGNKVYETIIPRNVRISEAPSYGKPVLVYDLKCVGSEAYLRLATEIIQREKALKAG